MDNKIPKSFVIDKLIKSVYIPFNDLDHMFAKL